jgi:phage tail-like protein
MSCPPQAPVFRLLDAYVGWDPLSVEGISGLGDPEGIALAGPPPSATSADEAAARLGHPRLARGADCCTFYLATDLGLLRRGRCAECFEPFWGGVADVPASAAVAAQGGLLAAADEAAGRVWLLREPSGQLVAEITVAGPRLVAFTPEGDVLVVRGDDHVLAFGRDGGPRGAVPYVPRIGARIVRVAVSREREVWALVERTGFLELMRVARGAWQAATPAALEEAFAPSGVSRADDDGFCLGDGCFGWDGCPIAPLPPHVPSGEPRRGQLLTYWLDSGIRRCEWHRVRAEGVVPPGTTVEIAVASAEQVPAAATSSTIAEGPWQGFAAGVPHALDWQSEAFASGDDLDFLIDQPRGRYLHVRVRMTSDGAATPRLRRVRIDMPRATSLQHLPGVYSDNPEAEDFTKRFLSLFDATVEGFDDAIERMPQLLDADHAPEAALPFLARLFAIELDGGWGLEQRRRVVREAIALYRRRGTLEGLRHAIELSFPGATGVAIRELAREEPWGALGTTATLGAMHLFGRSRARMRLGTSALGATPIRSYGDATRDPIDALAFRFEVAVAAVPGVPRELLVERLTDLVEAQKPAHTLATVLVGAGAYGVGTHARVGVDTVAVDPAPAVVGSIRLGASGVLGRAHPGTPLRAGSASVVGMHTTLC